MSDRDRSPHEMSRRDALKTATALAAAALMPSAMLAACARDPAQATNAASAPPGPTRDDATWLEDVADAILPTTAASPGAKAAGVGATMALLLADCRGADVQTRVADGLDALRVRCRALGADAFASLTPAQRTGLLREFDAAAMRDGATHWFSSVRELALAAYFSSELGMTRALRYVRIPGRYEGCTPLAPGQPAND